MNDILQLASTGDASKVLLDMRVRALWSPYYLCKVVLGYRELVPHLHYHDSELFIQRWAKGARRQWIEWPRGFFKSTLFTIGTSIWVVCPVREEDTEYALGTLGIPEEEWSARAALHDQDATQLFAYETDDNAKKKVAQVKWHFEENTLFRALFPEIAYQGTEAPWNAKCLKIRRVGARQRDQEGTFEAIGAGNALQSRHYKIVWEDDLVGKAAIESETEMEKTIHWHQLLNGAFEDAGQQIRFGVSNRWGYNDLNSYVRKNEPEFVFYTRKAYELDEDGKEVPIFPERFPLSALQEIRRGTTPYDFSCQYLNSPTLPGEAEVDLNVLHKYIVESSGTIKCSCGALIHPSQLLRTMHFDPYNAKGSGSKSRPAIAVIGTSVDKHIVLLDYYVTRASHEKLFQKLFALNDQWRPILFTYEDVGMQNMVEVYIRKTQASSDFTLRKFPRIIATKTGNRAKELRIRDAFIPTLTRFKFTCRESHLHFLEALSTFPHPTPDHDYDLLDALAQGAPLWRFPADEVVSVQDREAEDAYLAQLGKPYSYFQGGQAA